MIYLNKLNDLNKTCIIYKKETIVYDSSKRGVQPLIEFLSEKDHTYNEYILVDKIIGRGAVILAKLIGVSEIHTPIISEDALELANTYHMKCKYTTLVPYVINRDNTGRCPIESSVLNITDPEIGYEAIKSTLKKLMKK